MISTILRLVVNVLLPAFAGYLLTVTIVLSIGTWMPGMHAGAIAVIPMTGLITGLMCLLFYGARRLLARRTA